MNKILLMSKQPKQNHIIHIFFIIIILTSIIFSYSYKTYDSLQIIGIYTCNDGCYIDTSLSYEYITKIDNPKLLEYQNKNYKIEEIIYNEPYLNSNIPYQDLKIISNLKTSKKIVKVKLLYNKQRIITFS